MTVQKIINKQGELLAVKKTDPIYGSQDTAPIVIDAPARKGNFMFTSSGHKYWPLDPRAEEVRIEVVAHHLATRCRYNGGVQHPVYEDQIFYSVAEHSVYVSWYVEHVLGKPEYALEALLHDGSEAYNGDLIRPLKYDPLFRQPFKVVEDLNERAVAERYGLAYPMPECVKMADEAVTTAEFAQILVFHPSENWNVTHMHDDSAKAPYPISMLAPYVAKQFFLQRFKEVMQDRAKYAAVPS